MKRILHLFIYITLASLPVHGQTWKAGTIVSEDEVKTRSIDKWFVADTLSDGVMNRIKGKSWAKGCTLSRSNLRYLKLLHRNKDGKTQRGEMICNKAISTDLVQIFRKLYEADYVIERMVLIDEYDAVDEQSMEANNSSCFNFRFVSGTKKVSKHGKGLAVDINPLYNPCYNTRNGKTEPASGKRYVKNRTKKTNEMIIDKQDLCYKLFIAHGFRWGGNWRTKKDYQHFEK